MAERVQPLVGVGVLDASGDEILTGGVMVDVGGGRSAGPAVGMTCEVAGSDAAPAWAVPAGCSGGAGGLVGGASGVGGELGAAIVSADRESAAGAHRAHDSNQ